MKRHIIQREEGMRGGKCIWWINFMQIHIEVQLLNKIWFPVRTQTKKQCL